MPSDRPPRPAAPPADRSSARRDLERRLHDGPALRLSTLSIELGLAVVELRDPAARARLRRLQREVEVIAEELRDIGAAIYPPVLAAAGVGPALRAYAERRRLPLTVVAGPERFPDPVEAAAYFAVADALDADPGRAATVTVRREGANVVVWLSGGTSDGADSEVWIPCG